MLHWAGLFFLLLGVIFVVIGTLGVMRFADVYMRLQAASKSLTFGLIFTILAAGIYSADLAVFLKALLVIVFQFLTAPIAGHIIARVALRQGCVPKKLHKTLAPGNIPADPVTPGASSTDQG